VAKLLARKGEVRCQMCSSSFPPAWPSACSEAARLRPGSALGHRYGAWWTVWAGVGNPFCVGKHENMTTTRVTDWRESLFWPFQGRAFPLTIPLPPPALCLYGNLWVYGRYSSWAPRSIAVWANPGRQAGNAAEALSRLGPGRRVECIGWAVKSSRATLCGKFFQVAEFSSA